MSIVLVSNFRTWAEIRDANGDYLFSFPHFNKQCVVRGLPPADEAGFIIRGIGERVKAYVSHNYDTGGVDYILIKAFPEKVLEELNGLGYDIVTCVSKHSSNADLNHEEIVWTLSKHWD